VGCGILLVVAWQFTYDYYWSSYGEARNLLDSDQTPRDCAPPLDDDRLETVLDERARGNSVVFSGSIPFVGSGKVISSWTMSFSVSRERDGHQEPDVPFSAVELHNYLRHAVPKAGFGDLKASNRLYADGFDADRELSLLLRSTSLGRLPGAELDESVLEHWLRNRSEGLRTYLCLEKVGWHGQIVATMFLRAQINGESLFLELVFCALMPLLPEAMIVRLVPVQPRGISNAARSAAIRTMLPALSAGPINLIRYQRSARAAEKVRKAQEKLLLDGVDFDYGIETTVREENSIQDTAYFFAQADLVMYLEILKRNVLDCVQEFLTSRGVNLKEFNQQKPLVVNGVYNNIQNVSNSAILVGDQNKLVNTPAPRAPGQNPSD
jgi:hypothetical protein